MNSKIDLEKVEDIIVKNYKDKEFCINKLAQILDISVSYLRDIFYNNYSISPQQFIEKIRLEHVLRIYLPNLTLYELSDTVGFADERAFRRAFKKHFKITPSSLSKLYNRNSSNLQQFIRGLIHKLWINNKTIGIN